jgi:hypothetical protein
MKYKVISNNNSFEDIYEILEFNPDEDIFEPTGYRGSLADCEAWINLHEKGYMD